MAGKLPKPWTEDKKQAKKAYPIFAENWGFHTQDTMELVETIRDEEIKTKLVSLVTLLVDVTNEGLVFLGTSWINKCHLQRDAGTILNTVGVLLENIPNKETLETRGVDMLAWMKKTTLALSKEIATFLGHSTHSIPHLNDSLSEIRTQARQIPWFKMYDWDKILGLCLYCGIENEPTRKTCLSGGSQLEG